MYYKMHIKKVIASVQLLLKRFNDLEDSHRSIKNLTDFDGNKILEILECEYIHKNIKIKDNIYIIFKYYIKY